MSTLDEQIATKYRELQKLQRQREEELWKSTKCYLCNKTNERNELDGFGPLVDITVVVAEGEEGYALEKRYVCNDHLIEVCKYLIDGGFGNHEHGGINFLEIQGCEKCP